MIECKAITKKFDSFVALSEISFTVEKGVFGLLGTNGAGKTTTIKILVTLLRPTSGTALIDGIDVVKSPMEVKKKIGYLPEMPMLFEHLTGREFLELLGTLRMMDKKAIEGRIEELARMLGIVEYLDVLCSTLSKGTRQKLAFAGAVFHEPEYLFLDEPMLGMDPKYWHVAKNYIKDYGRNHVVFMSTHITNLAEEICDSIGIIHRGKLLACGKLGEVKGALSLEESLIEKIDAAG
ncbi:MAG: ABC transporter ATP-binding protein [Thermoplasmata archaeon]|nr:ABC transporter ATP-binding protein [Thermoplasmata archaeon]